MKNGWKRISGSSSTITVDRDSKSTHGLNEIEHCSPFSPPSLLRLQQMLASCSKLIESGDLTQSDQLISDLVEFLNAISDSQPSESNDGCSCSIALQALSEIHHYISLPSTNQVIIDALAFELPKAVARFADRSTMCLELADRVINRLIETCNSRDMLSILCEALDSPFKKVKAPTYFVPLLNGLAKALITIQRRHFEHVKASVPVVINVLKSTCSELDGTYTEILFEKAIVVANSTQEVCIKLEGKDKKLPVLLSLFVLQILALLSISMGGEASRCLPLVLKLSCFLKYCGLSYAGLVVGYDFETITGIVQDDGDDYLNCFCYVNLGASLAVIWSFISNEFSLASGVDILAIKDELRSSKTKRWQAFGMLKHIFSNANVPWNLKKNGISLLLCIMDGNIKNDEQANCSLSVAGLYGVLQAVQMVIMYAMDAELRKNAFLAFKKVLADVPTYLRYDILEALIRNNSSSSMVAILIDCVREEMHIEARNVEGNGILKVDNKDPRSTLWNACILQLIELVLRPPKGGPPVLPEYSDAVLSALNLYRFILITESTGKTNYSGILSRENLKKAYEEWFIPLRTLLTGILAESQKDYDQLACDFVYALNPVEVVLYRCIELVEEKQRRTP